MLPSMAITSHNSRIPFISGYENGHLNNYTTVFFLGLCYPFSTQEEERKKERDREGGKEGGRKEGRRKRKEEKRRKEGTQDI